jgi:glycosyltransferase involved in cell wall biosynthesis
MASADASVFPSTTETFGNAVLETQASGLPAIVSDHGAPAEIVRPHQSGIVVDVGQPLALNKAMDQLLGDPQLRADLRDRALRNAAKRDWGQILETFWGCEEADDRPARVADFGNAVGESASESSVLDLA